MITNRRIGGLRAKRAGDALERVIEFAAKDCMILSHLPPCGARFIGRGKIISELIPCDFAGAVIGRGTGVFFDAKSCAGPSMRLADPAIVKPHQADFLRDMDRCGCIAGLLVLAEKRNEYLWLNGRHLDARRGTLRFSDDCGEIMPPWIGLGFTSGLPMLSRLCGQGANHES
jgi:hypothetical protein